VPANCSQKWEEQGKSAKQYAKERKIKSAPWSMINYSDPTREPRPNVQYTHTNIYKDVPIYIFIYIFVGYIESPYSIHRMIYVFLKIAININGKRFLDKGSHNDPDSH